MRDVVGRVARAGFAGVLTVLMVGLVGVGPAGAAVPGRPTGVTAVVSGADGLSVSFLPPASNGGKVVKGYRATCSSDTGGVSRTVAGSASPVRVGSLTGGARYRCVVRAVNADGVGPASIGSTFVIVPGPPSKPYGLTVTVADGPRLRVAFKAPVSDGTSAITEYEARCVSGTTLTTTGKSTVSPVVTAVVQPGLAYRCKVRAKNAYGTGLWSAFSAATTVTGVGAPTALVATAGDTQVALTWTAPASDGGSAITDYIVQYRVTGAGSWSTFADGTSTAATATVTGLTNGTGYDFQVAAVNAAGTGIYSTSVTATPITGVVIAAGNGHTCALRAGTVKCWGYNGSGQLGLGDTADRGDGPGEMGVNLPAVDLGPGRTATAITAGEVHTCALLDDATIKCWGANGFGQLGLGDTETRGDGPGEMGVNLPAVDLGPGRTATAITAGGAHTCARLDDATVKCWGWNGFGQLGLGDTADRGDGPGEMGANLPVVDLGPGRTATAVTAGYTHTCALLDDATIKCWGANYAGQLGLGDTANRGDQSGEMGVNLPAVDIWG